MSEQIITDLVKANFNQHQIDTFAEDEKLLIDLYNGGNLDRWLAFVPRLGEIRTAAMRGQNSKNRIYAEAFGALLRRLLPSFWDAADNRVRAEATHLLWLGEEAVRMSVLAEYREKLTKAQLANLATPKAARDAVSRVLKARELERLAKAAGARKDDTSVGDELAEQREKDGDEPTATDAQLIAAFRKKHVTQIAVLLLEADQPRAKDLADYILNEMKQRKLALKEEARRAERAAQR